MRGFVAGGRKRGSLLRILRFVMIRRRHEALDVHARVINTQFA
jgi:hypothetical protein